MKKVENFFGEKYNQFQKKNLSMAIIAAKICGLDNNKIYFSKNIYQTYF